ncbi:DUF6292 family protein [Actinosynnema sp. CS-041913]|uniref:DUF6292 family protein n=1 Tax=Actinosynnema sp. CS-041913 TaxID=3239917 RepID=UPI003D8E1C99
MDFDFALSRELRWYVGLVATGLGLSGDGSYTDTEPPASAYLALDGRLPAFPERDLALLWDERLGWSAAVETHSGEDLIVLAYLGHDAVPAPEAVAAFVAELIRDHRPGDPRPVHLRTADHHDLWTRLRAANRGQAPRVPLCEASTLQAPEEQLNARSTEHHGLVVTAVSGEIDKATVGLLRAELTTQLAKRPHLLAVDLDGVTFLGAAGISLLIDISARARRDHTRLAVVARRRNVVNPILVTRADLVLSVHPTLDAAVTSAPALQRGA